MDPILAAIIAFLGSSFGSALTATVSATALVALVTKFPMISKWARRKIAGTKFMVVGPPQVGKSSFLNYLDKGKFADKSHVLKTATVSKKDGFEWSDENEKPIRAKSTLDLPGELTIEEQIDEIKKYLPEALIVVLSPSVNNVNKWVKDFPQALAAALKQDKRLRKSMASLTYVLNKSDTLEATQFAAWMESTEHSIKAALEPVLGADAERVGVIGCTLFKDKGGEKAAAAAAVKIALSLQQKEKLVNG